MTGMIARPVGRRLFLGGAAASALLALPGCASMGGFSLTEAIRRLLMLSSERAFMRLASDGGYWDDAIGKVGLGNFLGARGDILSSILTSALFKDRMVHAFAGIAERGADRAAPLVADAVRTVGIDNAVALVRGEPTAATQFLRGQMGMALVDAMVPELGQAMRIAEDPLVGKLIDGLAGTNVSGIAGNVASRVNNAIWDEMGKSEAEIRANPQGTNDPLLIGVFGIR
ncbi:MAG: DUF4197 domain-containing protein [Novosphingobium sp.]|nr:DUF4197 domain-containing protein [Novosphingobium sp.]